MKRHRFARALLAAGMSVMALAGATGIARAQPEPAPPPVPPIIYIFLIGAPAPWTGAGSHDELAPSTDWGGVGMYCENLFVRCE